MSAAEVTAVRESAGLFALPGRAVLRVGGADRVRWLNGMVSNDVAALEPGVEASGCYATLLSPQGRIIADLHVLQRGDFFWIETAAAAVEATLARLDRLIIADDVTLEDISASWARFALEGPRGAALLEAVTGTRHDLAAECGVEMAIAGASVVAAAFGFTGEDARQLFVPADRADAVVGALREAALQSAIALAEPSATVFEILRIEAGTPLFGSELAEDTLPDEARLERAISTTKGCYTGQEVVARLRSHGGVKHRLVGLVSESDDALPPPGTALEALERAGSKPGRATGEITSTCISPRFGPVGLGFVRRDDAAPGTALRAAGSALRVAALPFWDETGVSAGAAGDGDAASAAQ